MFVHVLLWIAFWHHVESKLWLLLKLHRRTLVIFDLLVYFLFLDLFILLLKHIKVIASSIDLFKLFLDHWLQLVKEVARLRACNRLRIRKQLLLC